MRTLAFLLTLVFLTPALAAAAGPGPDAGRILERYLATPHPAGPSKTDLYDAKADREVNNARLARIAILAELKTVPKEAVTAAGPVIFEKASPVQRYEIVGALADRIHTVECAELLHRVLLDVREPKDEDSPVYEELVRSTAVLGLRRMAARTERLGAKRIPKGPDFEPEVSGLVPYLISAANDKAPMVRTGALYALADSRDPAAQMALRKALQDSNRSVRLCAACLLTEFQDASGMAELRQALEYLLQTAPQSYSEAEMVLASLERITGKSFGEIPLNPMLASPDNGEPQRYKELLDAWRAWWNWQPTGEEMLLYRKKNP